MCERLSAAFAAVGCLTVLVAGASADNWNTGTGGNSSRNGYVAAMGPRRPAILWQGGMQSELAHQPVVANNLVVMTRTASPTDLSHGTRIVAHDLTTGDVRWNVEAPAEGFATDWRSRVSAVNDSYVFVTRAGDANFSHLHALRVSNGSHAWRSEHAIDECSSESLAFAGNGDIIVGNFSSVTRIRATDGTTVWNTPRTGVSSDSCAVAVYQNKLYIWESTSGGPCVTALNATTGERLYSSEPLGPGCFQQLGLMVGHDGAVYAPRSHNKSDGNSFVALSDNGARIVEKWRKPMPVLPFASFGVGPDNSVYVYNAEHRIVRLRGNDGNVIAMSDPISSDFHQPRMAIAADGSVYLTNGGLMEGMLYCFNSSLSKRWAEPVPHVGSSGPALSSSGILVVCGTGDDVRAYATRNPACGADWNASGGLDSQDLFDFLNDFFNNRADYNNNGITDSNDFFEFLEPFLNGC